MEKIKLKRVSNRMEVHPYLQNIPMPLWERMLAEGGLKWGIVTKFINEAIEEKLDREKGTSN